MSKLSIPSVSLNYFELSLFQFCVLCDSGNLTYNFVAPDLHSAFVVFYSLYGYQSISNVSCLGACISVHPL